MLYNEFRQTLSEVAPVYSLEGEDDYWVSKAYKDLLSLADEMDRGVFTPPDSVDAALSTLNSFPFLGERRVVVIRDVTLSAEEKKAVEAYIADPCPTAVLVLYHTGFAPKGAKACRFDKLTGKDLTDYIEGLLNQEGIAFDPDAVKLLADYSEEDMQQVEQSLVKLRAYLAGDKLTTQAVKAVVNPSVSYKLYRFCDLVERGDYVGCYRMIDALAQDGTDPAAFLATMTSHYRMAFYGKITRLPAAELGKKMGGKKEFPAKKALGTGGKYTAVNLLAVLKTLYQVEFDFKSGRTTASQALELAVAEAIERRSS